jgi:hypothetical protein
MEVITMDSMVYENLVKKIDLIVDFIEEQKKNGIDKEQWVETNDVCRFLSISAKTLSRLRQRGKIEHSKVGNKIFYKIDEIDRLLNNHTIRSSEANLKQLINHTANAKQKRNSRAN